VFFRVLRHQGEPENRVFHEIRWETPEKLADFDFVEGDTDFLRMLAG
jgi:hypothetical protein